MSVVPLLRPPTHDENREQAVRIEAEYADEMYGGPRQRLGRAKKARPAPVDERQKLREHILAMSLFPNLYNKSFLMRAAGSP